MEIQQPHEPLDDSQEYEADPLELTLDEVIALNKAKQEKEEIENDCLSVRSHAGSHKTYNGFKHQKGQNKNNWITPKFNLQNGNGVFPNPAHKMEINKRLMRYVREFGSKSIHKRLGYFHVFRKKFNHNTQQGLAQHVIRKAKYNSFMRSKKMANNVKMIQVAKQNQLNRQLVMPLKKSTVLTFNRMNNTRFISSSNDSTRSTCSLRLQPNIKRHSMSKSLNPSIQREIQELMTGVEISEEYLEDFHPSAESTNLSTHDRFSSYE